MPHKAGVQKQPDIISVDGTMYYCSGRSYAARRLVLVCWSNQQQYDGLHFRDLNVDSLAPMASVCRTDTDKAAFAPMHHPEIKGSRMKNGVYVDGKF